MALSHGDYIASLPLSSVDLRFHHLQQLLVPVLEILSKILINHDGSLRFLNEALDFKEEKTQYIFILWPKFTMKLAKKMFKVFMFHPKNEAFSCSCWSHAFENCNSGFFSLRSYPNKAIGTFDDMWLCHNILHKYFNVKEWWHYAFNELQKKRYKVQHYKS